MSGRDIIWRIITNRAAKGKSCRYISQFIKKIKQTEMLKHSMGISEYASFSLVCPKCRMEYSFYRELSIDDDLFNFFRIIDRRFTNCVVWKSEKYKIALKNQDIQMAEQATILQEEQKMRGEKNGG